MKKNRMMRMASVLLVLALLTTCIISGTFAKYVTDDKAENTARVAKFGVTVTAESNLFAEEYTTDDTTYDVAKVGTNSVVSTAASDDNKLENVVAPGTKGTLTKVTLSGTPEVAVVVSYSAIMKLDGWKVGDNEDYYCPIIITVDDEDISGLTFDDPGEFVSAVQTAIATHSQVYKANQDLSKISDDDALAVSWRWVFDENSDTWTEKLNKGQTDEKDTALGKAAAAENAATIQLDVTTTVTQID
jgi:hypothetical protein